MQLTQVLKKLKPKLDILERSDDIGADVSSKPRVDANTGGPVQDNAFGLGNAITIDPPFDLRKARRIPRDRYAADRSGLQHLEADFSPDLLNVNSADFQPLFDKTFLGLDDISRHGLGQNPFNDPYSPELRNILRRALRRG